MILCLCDLLVSDVVVCLCDVDNGIVLCSGVFGFCIYLLILVIVEGLVLLYVDYLLLVDDVFVDFVLELCIGMGLYCWWCWQVCVLYNGQWLFEFLLIDYVYLQLEWVLDWCVVVYVYDYLLLYVVVLECEGLVLMLLVLLGLGKSMLCVGLLYCGWCLLIDELVMVLLVDFSCYIVLLVWLVSLKNELVDLLWCFEFVVVFNEVIYGIVKGLVIYMKVLCEYVEWMDQIVRL